MSPKALVALSVLVAASAALSAAPAMALCHVVGVERAGPTSVWVYFAGPPLRVKLTHAGFSRVISVTPPPMQGDQQVKRPAILAQVGDRLSTRTVSVCSMDVTNKNGRLGLAVSEAPLGDSPGRAHVGPVLLGGETFIPARYGRQGGAAR